MTSDVKPDTVISETAIRALNGTAIAPVPVKLVYQWSPRIGLHVVTEELPVERAGLLSDAFEMEGPVCFTLENGMELQGIGTDFNLQWGKVAHVHGKFAITDPIETLPRADKLLTVNFDILNFPAFFGKHDQRHGNRETGAERLGTAKIRVPPWSIEIAAIPGSSRIQKRLRAASDIEVTHTGKITRCDGGEFSVQEARKPHKSLVFFLSFARQYHCGSTHIKGFDRGGQLAWENWGVPNGEPYPKIYMSWFGKRDGAQLEQAFPGFWRRWHGDGYTTLVAALEWYLASHEAKLVQVGNILVQAALEKLTATLLEEQGCKERGKPASQRIRAALKSLGVNTGIPAEYSDLGTYCMQNEISEGPRAIVEIRNTLVHSDMQHGILCPDVYVQARELGLWYVELMLLYFIDYRGQYFNRTAHAWQGQGELVPWAKTG